MNPIVGTQVNPLIATKLGVPDDDNAATELLVAIVGESYTHTIVMPSWATGLTLEVVIASTCGDPIEVISDGAIAKESGNLVFTTVTSNAKERPMYWSCRQVGTNRVIKSGDYLATHAAMT